jgi:hypothetical protein
MKKLHTLLALVLALLGQYAWAAPIGWYDLDANWRDGSFKGQFFYDGSAPVRVTAVKGVLSDLAQTTAIDKISAMDYDEPAPWVFLSNTRPADPGGHDAGFYLTLVDMGTWLSLDLSGLNGLYDWSSDAHYNPGQLDDSPLVSFSIAQSLPEPGTIMLLLGGMAGLLGMRRARS